MLSFRGSMSYLPGRRTGRATRYSQRGAALLVTVLLTAVAASIAVVVITQALNTSRSEGRRGSADNAALGVEETVRSLESELAGDSHFFLKRVSEQEAPRVCIARPAQTVVSPGSSWPSDCGSAWRYAPSAESDRLVHLTPPTPDAPLLTMRVLAREGDAAAGAVATYRLSGSGRYSVWTQDDLLLDDLSYSGSTTGLSGSIYSGGTTYLPTNSSVTITNAQLLAETGFAGTLSPDDLRYYTSGEDPAEPLKDIRTVAPSVLTASGLASGVGDLRSVACDTPAVALAGGYSTSLCLRSGTSLVKENGTSVVVPDGVKFYLLLPGVANTPGKVDVYYSTNAPSYTGDCLIECDLAALAAPEVAAGAHPGAANYWTSLGRFALPVSGVVATDADVQVGLCGTNFLTRSAACTTSSSGAPGSDVARSFTVLAGSVDDPKDLYVGSSIRSVGAARLGLVATGDVVIPYWARSSNSVMQLNAALVGLGLGGEADGQSSIRTLPASDGPAGDKNYAESLQLRGSVAAPALDLNLALFRSVNLTSDAGLMQAPPPYLLGFADDWETVQQRRMTLPEISAMSLGS